MTSDDLFAGDVAWRLRRIERELGAAVLDAQCRDWVAERPNRVVFARLDEVRREVGAAADRYGSMLPRRGLATTALCGPAWAATSAALLIGWSAADPVPWAVATAVAAGAGVAWLLSAVLRWARGRRAYRGVASADDPYFYAALRRRIEACAAAARADTSYRRRAAAADLDHALDWLAAAQAELPRRP